MRIRIPALVALSLVIIAPVRAAPVTFVADLAGINEFPANGSPATGFAMVIYDADNLTLQVVVDYENLVAPNTAAHIHCCVSPSAAVPTAGVATTTPTFPGFPTGTTSGSYDNTLDLTLASSYRAGFITGEGGGTVAGAQTVLVNGLFAGQAYLNIHSTTYLSGEIRGFLQTPIPAAVWLLGSALGVLGWIGRKSRI